MRTRLLSAITIILLFLSLGYAQTEPRYQTPTADIVKMVEAPPFPSLSVSPDGRLMVMSERPGMPSIEDLSQPMLRLAGTRINPLTNGSFSTSSIV
jgi:hypothetical protein